MYLYHKFQFIRNLTSKFLKSTESKIPVKQVVSVAKDQFPMVQSMDHKLKSKMKFINESTTDEETFQEIDCRLTEVEITIKKQHNILVNLEVQNDGTVNVRDPSDTNVRRSQSQLSVYAHGVPNDNQLPIYGSTPNLQQQQPPPTNATTTQIPTNTSKTT